MDDATVQRKRIPKLDEMAGRLPSMHDASEPNTPQNNKVLDALYEAYTDGLKESEIIARRNSFMGRHCDEGGMFGGPGSCEYGCGEVIANAIRQHAKEMGHE